MNMSQFAVALDHIDNQELARLEELWRAQASSGHAEARSIAHSFATEQRRRSDQAFSVLPNAGTERKKPAWHKSGFSYIYENKLSIAAKA